jgi:WD40 repeat protein
LSIPDAHAGKSKVIFLKVDSVMHISVSSDDKYLATGCIDNSVKIWDCSTAKELHLVFLPFQASKKKWIFLIFRA